MCKFYTDKKVLLPVTEALPVVGAMLDGILLVFILLLHRKKDDRTWTQRMGATFMLWFIVCHLGYQWSSGVFGYNFQDGGDATKDIMGVLVWNLWRIGLLAFFLAMITVPMPWFKKGNTYLKILGFLLFINLLEAWFVHGTPAYSDKGWGLWFAMSPLMIIMLLVYTYTGWSYLTSKTSGEDNLEKITDKAGLFGIMAVTLWAGKNWFDWMGIFTRGEMFYSYWPAYSHPLPLFTALTWNLELLMVGLSLFVLFIGAILHLNKKGSRLLGGFLVFVLFAGMVRYYFYQSEQVDYDLIGSILNEASVSESFTLLTHGVMQSLARPLIILFLCIRFGFVKTDHLPRLSRAMIIMALAGSMSTITEILQPILGISQLVSGFLLGAVLAFEFEKKVLKAMQPPDDDFNPTWIIDGDPKQLEKWTNIGFAAFLVIATLMVVMLTDKGVV